MFEKWKEQGLDVRDVTGRGRDAPPEPSPEVEEALPKSRKERARLFVGPLFAPPGTWVLPIHTASEVNKRKWQEKSARTVAARAAVSRELGSRLEYLAPFGVHFHKGGTLEIRFTRLGGNKLDRANLGSALKATEDAVALMLGASDGDPRWDSSFHQEPGGKLGVRVEIRITKGATDDQDGPAPVRCDQRDPGGVGGPVQLPADGDGVQEAEAHVRG